jgi:hypothetical protein
MNTPKQLLTRKNGTQALIRYMMQVDQIGRRMIKVSDGPKPITVGTPEIRAMFSIPDPKMGRPGGFLPTDGNLHRPVAMRFDTSQANSMERSPPD